MSLTGAKKKGAKEGVKKREFRSLLPQFNYLRFFQKRSE